MSSSVVTFKSVEQSKCTSTQDRRFNIITGSFSFSHSIPLLPYFPKGVNEYQTDQCNHQSHMYSSFLVIGNSVTWKLWWITSHILLINENVVAALMVMDWFLLYGMTFRILPRLQIHNILIMIKLLQLYHTLDLCTAHILDWRFSQSLLSGPVGEIKNNLVHYWFSKDVYRQLRCLTCFLSMHNVIKKLTA